LGANNFDVEVSFFAFLTHYSTFVSTV
jgi:hypothetical protein